MLDFINLAGLILIIFGTNFEEKYYNLRISK